MFQFPAFASRQKAGWHRFTVPGCPIRKSRDQRVFAPTPGLSQLVTSFVASRSLGIHRLPCSRFSFFFHRAPRHTAAGARCRLLAGGATRAASCFFFVFPACQRSLPPPCRALPGRRGGTPRGRAYTRAAGSCRTAAPPPGRVEDKGLEPLASCVQGRRSEPTELIPRERSPRQS